jgi:parvulin-like peptidyl-prolyl isomerase
LLDNYIKEEVFYREGKAQGLMEGDPVIRRRIRQKMDVLAEENVQDEPPSETDLSEWLKNHADRYSAPPIVSFSQVIFGPAKLRPDSERAIAEARAKLNAGADPAKVGEITLLPMKVDRVSLDRVAQDFGEEFANTVSKLPSGAWQGPVRSGYGLHLVRVTYHQAGRKLDLAEVRQDVARDWESNRRDAAAKVYFDQLRSQYDVQVKARLPAAAMPSETRP